MPLRVCCRTLAPYRCSLALFSIIFTLPAWPQNTSSCTIPPGVDLNPTGTDFFSSFNNSTYEIPIRATTGATAAGDLNSTYFPLYYSITNMNSWMQKNNYCPLELVIVGTFPDVRYFSIATNDMHYTGAQHLADADIDPVGSPGSSTSNPFVPGAGGQSPSYNGAQQYLVPVSLGYVPNVSGKCSIDPFEQDNLLDVTQRHLGMDWNTTLQGPNVAEGLAQHVVDTPGHATPNAAGSIILRSYLAPAATCTGAPGAVTCSQPNDPSQQPPHLIVRDAQSGCAYKTSYLLSPANNLVYAPSPGTKQLDCSVSSPPAACAAIVSTQDLSVCPATEPGCVVPNWLDQTQKSQHTLAANLTPQGCFANGNPAQSAPYGNKVAWVRAPQWNGSPGPDDSYIGGAISTTDLAGMTTGSACQTLNQGDQCLIRMRFQLPPNTPKTPCPYPGPACHLNASAQMRYMSLSLWYQTAPPPNDPDTRPANGNSPISIVSVADAAFVPTNGYVTLLVNIGPTSALPAWLQPANGTPQTLGVRPATNSNSNYSLWTTAHGYSVLDLSQFSNFYTSFPLLFTLRNTLPAGGFLCSGTAVPFSTAEYTTGGGMMGPYVPLVDYVDPNDPNGLPQTPPPLAQSGLPSASACGKLPSKLPGFNSPSESGQIVWPNQYWSSAPGTAPPNLYCPVTAPSPGSPQIDFVATQYPVAVDTGQPRSPQNCDSVPNGCSQLVVQSPQTTGVSSGSWQPPLPVTIVGSGFGFLPNLPNVAVNPHFVEITDCPLGSTLCPLWDTATTTACQVYISNWTDTGISLLANLSVGVSDMYSPAILSPLTDFSPLTFAASPACPVGPGDTLAIAVTNPQSGAVTNPPMKVVVSPAGTIPF